jgi:protocatechuate 3,4-dioxygenase beta subunit
VTEFPPRDRAWHPPPLSPEYKSTRLRAPQHALLQLPVGPAEAHGPVFHSDLIGPLDHDLIHNYASGEISAIGPRIVVHGRVVDEDARPLSGVLIEVWQANAGGRYRHKREGYLAPLDPNFGGCGRAITDGDGAYQFHTIMPGAYPWPNGPNSWRPAHIHFSLFGHAFAQRLITQMYFEGDPLIPLCPIVQSVPDVAGVVALTARLDMDGALPMDSLAYRFDIVLRGRKQTPFENQTAGL